MAATCAWDGRQDAVGPATRVRQAQVSEKCEHGMELEHQTCVQGVGPTHTLFLVNGEYWKQGDQAHRSSHWGWPQLVRNGDEHDKCAKKCFSVFWTFSKKIPVCASRFDTVRYCMRHQRYRLRVSGWWSLPCHLPNLVRPGETVLLDLSPSLSPLPVLVWVGHNVCELNNYCRAEFINTAAATNGGHDCLGGAFYEFKVSPSRGAFLINHTHVTRRAFFLRRSLPGCSPPCPRVFCSRVTAIHHIPWGP